MTADITEVISTALIPVANAPRGPIHQYTSLAYHAIWSGTPAGTLQLEASGDGGTTWELVPGTAQAAGGAAGHWLWNFWQPPGFDEIRFKYVFSASTGTLNVWFNAKGP